MANAVFRPVDYAPVDRDDDYDTLLPPDLHHLSDHASPSPRTLSPKPPRRQSSLAQVRPDGTPRTANRVRFDFDHQLHVGNANGAADSQWLQADDPTEGKVKRPTGRQFEQRAPLLSDMDAPSVLLACEEEEDDNDNDDFNPEQLLESARPKSGMKSAFMNMANSIMWVHCSGLQATEKLT